MKVFETVIAPSDAAKVRSVADEWRASQLSHLTFSWLFPLVKLGRKQTLQPVDLGAIAVNDSAQYVTAQFNHLYIEQGKPVWYALARPLLWRVGVAGIAKLLGDVLGFVAPILLSTLLDWLVDENPDVDPNLGYWLGLGILASALLQTLFLQRHHHLVIRAGIQARNCVMQSVFDKSMTLPQSAFRTPEMSTDESNKGSDSDKQSGGNQAVNIQSIDSEKLMYVFYFVHYLWAAPLQSLVVLYLLYNQLGASGIAGVGTMVALVPIQLYVGDRLKVLGKNAMAEADTRIKYVREVLGAMKLVKVNALEQTFIARIQEARKQELKLRWKMALLQACNTTLLQGGPVLVGLVAFLVFASTTEDGSLTPARAFTALTLFNMLRLPLMALPMMVRATAAASVSIKRFSDYLALEPHIDYRRFVNNDGDINGSTNHITAFSNDSINANGDDIQNKSHYSYAKRRVVVRIENASFAWSKTLAESNQLALKDVEATVPFGQLTVVIGRVGAGKTAFLSSLMGEMTLVEGRVLVVPVVSDSLDIEPNTQVQKHAYCIAYCSQTPFIFNATVRDNILMGEPLDEARYQLCIWGSAFDVDIASLPAGHDTQIGERGVTLSGGQKARVSIARALYRHGVYMHVFDDVLSAVDSMVAREIIQRLFCTLLRNATKVLATHQETLIEFAGSVVRVGCDEDGVNDSSSAISVSCTLQEPKESAFSHAAVPPPHLINALQDYLDSAGTQIHKNVEVSEIYGNEMSNVSGEDFGKVKATKASVILPTASVLDGADDVIKVTISDESVSSNEERYIQEQQQKEKNNKSDNNKPNAEAMKTKDEHREEGVVKGAIYKYYAAAFGSMVTAICAVLIVASNGTRVGNDLWLGGWATNEGNHTAMYYVSVYAGIACSNLSAVLAFTLLFAWGSVRAAQRLHDRMLIRLMRSPMSFFDQTPAGRILNRFTTDVTVMDEKLPEVVSQLLLLGFQVAVVVVVQVVVLYYIALVLVVVGVIYFSIMDLYRRSFREVNRIVQVTKSPIYSQLSECLAGVATLRAYGDLDSKNEENERRIDANTIAFYKMNMMNRWLGLRLDSIGAFVTFFVVVFVVLRRDDTAAGVLGLVLTYSLAITSDLNWLVRQATDGEAAFNAIERIVEYSKLPSEAQAVIQNNRPDKNWPSQGDVRFVNVSLRYRPGLPLALSGVNVHFPAGSKVGVCGRTGSGKSTLLTAMFRLVEIESDEGRGGMIEIDGVDISRIGLADLRSRINLVPQDPLLFAGTLRYNLDVLGEHSDAQLWEALELAQIKSRVMTTQDNSNNEITQTNPKDILPTVSDKNNNNNKLPIEQKVSNTAQGLDSMITELGGNWSSGERQLICCARILLKRETTRVIAFDEASSSVDKATDEKLQKALRDHLGTATVITIAHRLNTIMHSDLIAVMDAGKVIEWGAPRELLKKSNGMLSELVAQAEHNHNGSTDA